MRGEWCQVASGTDPKSNERGRYWQFLDNGKLSERIGPNVIEHNWSLQKRELHIAELGDYTVKQIAEDKLMLATVARDFSFDRDCKDERAFHERSRGFIEAVKRGETLTVRKLLDAGGIDLDVEYGPDAATALMLAVTKRNLPLTQLLLSRGAEVNRVNKKGENTVTVARQRPATGRHAREKAEELIDLLESAQSGDKIEPPTLDEEPKPQPKAARDERAEDGRGERPAAVPIKATVPQLVGAWKSKEPFDTVLLLEDGKYRQRTELAPGSAKVEDGTFTLADGTFTFMRENETDIDGRIHGTERRPHSLSLVITVLTPTHLTMRGGPLDIDWVYERTDATSARAGIDADANPPTPDLGHAKQCDKNMKDPRLAQVLAGEGPTALQQTAFCNAAALGDIASVKDFIDRGIELDRLDSRATRPKTALIMAINFGRVEIVKLLLARGASKQVRDSEGKTALDYAKQTKHPELLALLR